MFGKGGKRIGTGRPAGRPPGRPTVPATRAERVAKAQVVAEMNSEAAIRLLSKQFKDKELSAKDRREAAIAVLKTANLPILTAEELDKFGGMTRGSLENKIQLILNGVKTESTRIATEITDSKAAEKGTDIINRLLNGENKCSTEESTVKEQSK